MRIVSSNFFSHVPYRILTSNENCCLNSSVRPINNRARDYIFLKTIKIIEFNRFFLHLKLCTFRHPILLVDK